MIKQLNLLNFAVVFVLTLVMWLIGTPQQAVNCAFAGALAGVNLSVIVWSLRKLFQKKSVALALGVIVIKYAAIFGIFVVLYSVGWQLDIGFAIGLSSMFPTLGFIAYRHLNSNGINQELN